MRPAGFLGGTGLQRQATPAMTGVMRGEQPVFIRYRDSGAWPV
jgi:hypothetical protein